MLKGIVKRILIYRSGLSTDRVNIAIKELSLLLYEFNKILKDEEVNEKQVISKKNPKVKSIYLQEGLREVWSTSQKGGCCYEV